MLPYCESSGATTSAHRLGGDRAPEQGARSSISTKTCSAGWESRRTTCPSRFEQRAPKTPPPWNACARCFRSAGSRCHRSIAGPRGTAALLMLLHAAGLDQRRSSRGRDRAQSHAGIVIAEAPAQTPDQLREVSPEPAAFFLPRMMTTEENPLVVTTRTAHMGSDEGRYFGRAVFEDLTGEGVADLPHGALHPGTRAASGLLPRARRRRLRARPRQSSYLAAQADPAGHVLWFNRSRGRRWLAHRGGRPRPPLGLHQGRGGGLSSFEARIGSRTEPEHVRSVVEEYLAAHRFVWGFGQVRRERDERSRRFPRLHHPPR